MPKRQHKKFTRPKKLYDLTTIKEENALINQYGLKSRREIWSANFEIGKIRGLAKELITADEEKKKEFVERQAKKGFNVTKLQDVLALNKEDRLKRRLQTIVSMKFGMVPKLARQLITHKHVKIGSRTINSPRHLTTIEEEADINLTLAWNPKKSVSDEEKALLKKMNIENKEVEAK